MRYRVIATRPQLGGDKSVSLLFSSRTRPAPINLTPLMYYSISSVYENYACLKQQRDVPTARTRVLARFFTHDIPQASSHTDACSELKAESHTAAEIYLGDNSGTS